MEALLFEIGPFVLYPAIFLIALYAGTNTTSKELRKKVTKELQLVSEEMKLSFQPATNGKEILLTGLREGIPVEARIALTGGTPGTLVVKPGGLNPDLRIMDTLERRNLGPLEGLEDHKVGEPYFDSLLVVQGPPPDIYAALSEDARSAVIEAIANDGFRLEHGRIELELTAREGKWIRRNFAILLQVGKQFVMAESRAARYFKNYGSESTPLIALRNAKFLLQEEPGSSEAKELTRILLKDARKSFVHGEVNGLVTSPSVRPATGHRESLGLYDAPPSKSGTEVTTRCLGFATYPEWLEVLSLLMPRAPEPTLLVTQFFLRDTLHVDGCTLHPPALTQLASAIGGSATARARQILWTIIRVGHGDITSAIMSLGRIGQLEDVEPLMEHPSGLFDIQLKSAIDTAITAIQERAEGGGAGTLALVDEKSGDGALSLDLSEGGLSSPTSDETRD